MLVAERNRLADRHVLAGDVGRADDREQDGYRDHRDADDHAQDPVYRDGYLYVTSQSDHALVVLAVGEAIRRLATP